MNIGIWLERTAQAMPDRAALFRGRDQVMDYAGFDHAAREVAAAFRRWAFRSSPAPTRSGFLCFGASRALDRDRVDPAPDPDPELDSASEPPTCARGKRSGGRPAAWEAGRDEHLGRFAFLRSASMR